MNCTNSWAYLFVDIIAEKIVILFKRILPVNVIFKLNLRILLGYSFALVIASVIGTGIIWARWADGFSYVFPTCTVIIYALVPLNDSTFRLRDKVRKNHKNVLVLVFQLSSTRVHALTMRDPLKRLLNPGTTILSALQLPISTMESAALFASFLGVAACFAASNYFPAALPGSILATAVCFLFYVRFDHLEHKVNSLTSIFKCFER